MISDRLHPNDICEKVKVMCQALAHGGPDDEGIFCDEKKGLVFGNRRLAIIDLSKNGHMPMADVEQKVWITFNGEIFNYLELKAQLVGLGARFHSGTDTEVIINGYIHWGMACFSRLRGIFAFALYDKEKGLTYLVRDSCGIKPLYYYVDNGQLSFTSEIKALKKAGLATEEDDSWQIRFLAYGHIPEPFTTLKNVYSLPKGEFLVWNHFMKSYAVHAYRVKNDDAIITEIGQAKDALRGSLTKAVDRQLIADAPIGVFLSGGTDSSLLTLLAHQQKKSLLNTVSIYFNEEEYDERTYQGEILKQISGEKFAHLVRQEDFEEFLPEILGAMDMPTTDGINTWFISKFAHEDGLKAVLSGVGADELFGGYPSFNRIKYIKTLRNYPKHLFKIMNYSTSDRFKKISYLAYYHPVADYLLLRGLFSPLDISKILDIDLDTVENTLFNNKRLPYIRNYNEQDAAWFETNLYMQNQLLRDTDVMSMSHGLEVRVPFLDEDFKRVAENIAPDLRFSKRQPKKILVDSFTDFLPHSVWNRPKMGFSFPLQEWMRKHREINIESSYSGRKAKSIVKAFKGNNMHWSKIFALYQIQGHV